MDYMHLRNKEIFVILNLLLLASWCQGQKHMGTIEGLSDTYTLMAFTSPDSALIASFPCSPQVSMVSPISIFGH